MAQKVLIYAVQWGLFADEAYVARNFRMAKAKSRDTRRLRSLHGEIPENHTSMGEYRQAYRAYVNARRQRRRGDDVLEQKTKESEQPTTKPTPKKANNPKKGMKTPHGQWLNGRWWAARAPGEQWPGGTSDCKPFGPPWWISNIEKERSKRKAEIPNATTKSAWVHTSIYQSSTG